MNVTRSTTTTCLEIEEVERGDGHALALLRGRPVGGLLEAVGDLGQQLLQLPHARLAHVHHERQPARHAQLTAARPRETLPRNNKHKQRV